MEFLIAIIIFIYIVYKVANKRPQKMSQTKMPPPYPNITTTIIPLSCMDSDIIAKNIIDISKESCNLQNNIIPEEAKNYKIPYWSHKSIYSLSDLDGATSEQKAFYYKFKRSFINKEYLDLDYNLNYAFILLFDLLNDYKKDLDMDKLNTRFEALGRHYPKTKSYCASFLIKELESIGNKDRLLEAIEREPFRYSGYDYSKKMSQTKMPPPYRTTNIIPPSRIDPDIIANSIIDISKESYNLQSNIISPEKASNYKIPHWSHKYIYSLSDLDGATSEQKAFYYQFKRSFINKEYLDLDYNLNYAFILLFDLLNDYKKDLDVDKLNTRFEALGTHYPKTKSYCVSFLVKELESIGNNRLLEVMEKDPFRHYDSDYWKAGFRYKKKLNLNEAEVELLNKLWYPSNSFCDIEFCKLQIYKLYIALAKTINDKFAENNISLEQMVDKLADFSVKSEYNYRRGSENYKYRMQEARNHLYQNIFKHCENEVRGHYEHKRKLNTDLSWSIRNAQDKYSKGIGVILSEELPNLVVKTIQQPDQETEKQLNQLNTTRWRVKLDRISTNYLDCPQKYKEEVIALGKLNEKNPSVENIFFEASKLIAKNDKETALSLYIYYLHYDLQSTTFDNKQLNKTIQKSLFKTDNQLLDFERVINEFIANKDINKALEGISDIFAVRRKKISVDKSLIKEVQTQYSETVELLNEYLKEETQANVQIKQREVNSEEIQIDIVDPQIYENKNNYLYLLDIGLTNVQLETLTFFVKNSLSVSLEDFGVYAKNKNQFPNRLIDGLNEVCFDTLDDLLIEQNEEYYIIDENYYQNILAK